MCDGDRRKVPRVRREGVNKVVVGGRDGRQLRSVNDRRNHGDK